jgi:hypothetical protein
MTSTTRAETTTTDQPRYSEQTLRQITLLAEQLQAQEHRRDEQLTARDVEAVGAEVGIEPDFMRQALAEVASRPALARLEHGRRAEFWSLVGALALPLVWGAVAYLCGFSHGLQQFLTLIAPAPLALILGFVAGRKSAGIAAGISLVVSLAPALSLMLTRMHSHNVEGPTVLYVMIGSLLLGWLGRVAAELRAEYFPLPSARQSVTREEMLSLIATLQPETDGNQPR